MKIKNWVKKKNKNNFNIKSNRKFWLNRKNKKINNSKNHYKKIEK
jgi:hypothetical protein